MPRRNLNGREFSKYFNTPEEKIFWQEFAKGHGKSLNALIDEALAELRDKESAPVRPDLTRETKELKRDLQELEEINANILLMGVWAGRGSSLLSSCNRDTDRC
jgi:hypothetical protein